MLRTLETTLKLSASDLLVWAHVCEAVSEDELFAAPFWSELAKEFRRESAARESGSDPQAVTIEFEFDSIPLKRIEALQRLFARWMVTAYQEGKSDLGAFHNEMGYVICVAKVNAVKEVRSLKRMFRPRIVWAWES